MCSIDLTTATAEERDEIFECMEMAKDIGAKYVKLHTGAADCSLGFDKSYKNLIENLKLFVKHAEDNGMKILIENCPMCIVYSPSDLLKIFKEIDSDSLRCLCDPCNFYVMEFEPYPYAFEMLKDYIEYCHIKDTKRVYARPASRSVGGTPEAHKLFSSKFKGVPLGQGGINYEGLLKKLRIMNYDGFLAFEPENVHQELVEKWITDAKTYLESKGF
jgi:sugar phosphate isomerase/epimerase